MGEGNNDEGNSIDDLMIDHSGTIFAFRCLPFVRFQLFYHDLCILIVINQIQQTILRHSIRVKKHQQMSHLGRHRTQMD